VSDTTPLLSIPSQKTEFLLQHARVGHDGAWKALYDRYRRMLMVRVECRMPGFLRRRFDAEDVLQEAFSKAWVQIESFEYQGEGSFRRWLSRIVLHEFWNLIRAQEEEQKHKHDPTSSETMDLDSLHRESVLAPSQVLSLAESKAQLLQKLEELPEEDQDLIILRMFEKKDWEEIGTIMGYHRTHAREQFELALGRLARSVR
jgi:RNA polymerase sigma factor (sigma-70 family)